MVTNDGELANRLTSAASGVEKTYLVKVAGQPTEAELDILRGGVSIERGKPGSGQVRTSPARIRQVRQGDNPWYEVVLIEGRNRELRKMFERVGHFVEKIRRVGYGPLVLDQEPGNLRELEPRRAGRSARRRRGQAAHAKIKGTPPPQRDGRCRLANRCAAPNYSSPASPAVRSQIIRRPPRPRFRFWPQDYRQRNLSAPTDPPVQPGTSAPRGPLGRRMIVLTQANPFVKGPPLTAHSRTSLQPVEVTEPNPAQVRRTETDRPQRGPTALNLTQPNPTEINLQRAAASQPNQHGKGRNQRDGRPISVPLPRAPPRPGTRPMK